MGWGVERKGEGRREDTNEDALCAGVCGVYAGVCAARAGVCVAFCAGVDGAAGVWGVEIEGGRAEEEGEGEGEGEDSPFLFSLSCSKTVVVGVSEMENKYSE